VHLSGSRLWVLASLGLSIAVSAAADPFVINEVVGDPQSDWSQSAGGGGGPFSGTPGSGTVDPGDEYVEIRNVSGSVQSLENFTLEMADLTPETDCFAFSPSGVSCSQSAIYRVFDAAGTEIGSGTLADRLHNVPVGGYVVLGNPNGSISNSSALVLRDTDAAMIVDEVDFGGDAPSLNAASPQDEAISRFPDGSDSGVGADDFVAQAATLGASNGEPSVPAMGPGGRLGLAALLVACASRLRARPSRAPISRSNRSPTASKTSGDWASPRRKYRTGSVRSALNQAGGR